MASEPGVEMLSAEEIASRREALIAQLGMPLDEARERAADYALSVQEYATLLAIDGLGWLLGKCEGDDE